jgi:hypothetical protein
MFNADCPLCRRRFKLYIHSGRDGATVLHCFVCGSETAERICALLGVRVSVLFPEASVQGSYASSSCVGGSSEDFGATSDVLTPVSTRRQNCDQLLDRASKGDLIPEKFDAPPLPNRAGDRMRAVYGDFGLLTGLRLKVGDRRPIPYAVNWAADRLGLSPGAVHDALGRLVAAGVLECRGSLPPKDLSPLEDVPAAERKRWTRCYVLAGVGRKISDAAVPVHSGAAEASLRSLEGTPMEPQVERAADLHPVGVAETFGGPPGRSRPRRGGHIRRRGSGVVARHGPRVHRGAG